MVDVDVFSDIINKFANLFRSNYYRTIKLLFIGNSKRGKTTLLHRLQHMAEDKHVERTAGIDIAKWTHPDPRKPTKADKRKPVNFIAWDFAGQVSSKFTCVSPL